ncbi:MAG: gliding motility-associated-like protein, partial [Crocinitomicaceae bacterium]
FTILPAIGLPINAGTGFLSVNGATPGVYTVTYTTLAPCSNTSNVIVTITAIDDASFNYSAAAYCVNDVDQAATITGEVGGGFTILPAVGLPINAGTGFLSVNGATPGVYTVTYTTLAPCSNTSNVVVTINAMDNAAFNYSAAAYCVNDVDQAATITGLGGGGFTILPAVGLPINAGTGFLSVNGATPGVYTVTYTTVGPCPSSSNVVVTINAMDNAGFNYSAAAFCVNDVDQAATITGLGGGGFTILPAIGLPINAGTGFLSVNGATPGVYTVTYTTAGTCPNSSNVVVTINALDNASFNYSAAAYCVNDVDQAATITGLGGGGFTILPAIGLPINAGTGFLSVNGATPGVYTATYTTAGTCPNTSNVIVTINALDNAAFNYSAAAYCVADVDQAATITGLGGGGFTILPAIGLPINTGTGFLSVNGATPGVYTVTYTTVGACPNSSNVVVTITALDNAGFNYSAASYCAADPDQAVTITGEIGGGFTILPAVGLPINAGSGLLSVNGATPGVYTVTYTTLAPCSNTSNVVVTITALDNAAFNYSAAAYCVNDVDQAATITGEPGGGFTILPAVGLPINAGTGFLSVNGATPGVYTVTYTTLAPCSNTSNVVVTINAMDNAGFNYSAAAYCPSDIDQAATITGLGGGGFTILPAIGLPINAGSGLLSVNGATPGVYTVTYTTAGTCPNTSNVVVTINTMDNAVFNYSAAAYCPSDVDQAATITGLAGGGFTILPAVGLPINAGTGFVSVNGATPGVYTVTYTTVGTCPNSSNVVVTINAMDNAAFNYSAAAYCTNALDQAVTITGLGGGGFTILPAVGLPINAVSGLLMPSGATPGAYTITYTTVGTCPNSSNVVVTINAMDNAAFNYSAAAYCPSDVDQAATITGLGGGGFTILPAVGLPINAGSGLLSVNGATPGVYTVTYTTTGTCPNTSNVVVTINALDNAAFNFSAVSYCVADLDQAVTVTGLAGGSFSILPGVGLPINAGTGLLSVNGATPGVYTITYTTAGTCPNSSNLIVTILAADITAFTTTPTCDGGTSSAPATAGGTFTFAIAPLDGAVIDPITGTVTGGTSGATYSIEYTTLGACGGNSIQPVTVLPNPVITPIADLTVCDSYPLPAIVGINLSGNEAYYNNSQALGGTVISGSITTTQTIYIYDANGACSDETSFVVTINITEDASFTLTDYCDGAANVALITGTAGGTFAFNPAVVDGATVDAVTGAVTSGVPGTTYSIEYTTSGACPASSIEQITVFAFPVAPTVSGDQTYCASEFMNDMTATGGAGSLTWYDDFGLSNVIGTGGTQTPYSTTGVFTYYVTETENGCEGLESSIVITIEDCDVLIPTAFTPDGDGANDDWELQNIDNIYPNNVVKVYNRWGNLLFESAQGSYDTNRWDGTFKGNLLPVASYYYIIEPNADGAETMTGSVSIILN